MLDLDKVTLHFARGAKQYQQEYKKKGPRWIIPAGFRRACFLVFEMMESVECRGFRSRCEINPLFMNFSQILPDLADWLLRWGKKHRKMSNAFNSSGRVSAVVDVVDSETFPVVLKIFFYRKGMKTHFFEMEILFGLHGDKIGIESRDVR